MKMGTFTCPSAVKIIQHFCRRNLHSIVKLHNSTVSSVCIPYNVNLYCKKINLNSSNNISFKCNSTNAAISTDIQNESENKPENENPRDLYSNVDYDAITGGDKDLLKKLKIYMLEVEVMLQEGCKVPSSMKTSHWKELLMLETRTARKKLLTFYFLNEMKRKNNENKKAKKQLEITERKIKEAECEKSGHIRYGFGGSTIFLRVYPSTIDNFFNSRLVAAMKFSQNLVIDCSYDCHMTSVEAKNCGKQLMLMFSDNRNHDEPYNLHFCNADPKMRVIEHLHKNIPPLYEPSFPINITEKSYLDIFPKDKLVYLTPHCRNELTTFSHDDIYIIGAFVDKGASEAHSLAKAKSEGLRMACLPLDKYLLWHIGSKSLTLNQVLLILLDIRKTGSWQKALEHVPKRKLVERQRDIHRRYTTDFSMLKRTKI